MQFQIIRVLPERHPSRPYAAELERRFQDAEGVFVQSHPVEVSPSSPAAHEGGSAGQNKVALERIPLHGETRDAVWEQDVT